MAGTWGRFWKNAARAALFFRRPGHNYAQGAG